MTENALEVRPGYAVQVTKKDGEVRLAKANSGDLPAVWSRANRARAVAFADQLRENGMKCSVVDVNYIDPVVVGRRGIPS